MKFLKSHNLIIIFILAVFVFGIFVNTGLAYDQDAVDYYLRGNPNATSEEIAAYLNSSEFDNSGFESGSIWTNMQECRAYGNCTLNHFILLAINISSWILGIVGSLALLMFIYGGLMMIISQGSSDKVEQSKTILKNAIIGLIIVFTSWTIISFIVTAFVPEADKINDKVWYQLSK